MTNPAAARRRTEPQPAGWLAMLLDLPFVGVAVCHTRDRRWSHVNERFCLLIGRTREELLRMNWRDICHAGDHAAGLAAFRRLLLRSASHVRLPLRLLHRDGHVVPVEVDLSFLRARSTPRASQIVALVTELVPARAEPQGFTAETIFRDGNTPMVVLDAQSWEVIDANPAAERFYGWSLAEIRRLGIRVWDVSQADRASVMQRLREAAAGGVGRLEGVHRTASGEARAVEVFCGPVTVGGRPGVYGIVHDRTSLRQAEVARDEAEEKLQALIEQSITGIYIIEDGRISYGNQRMADIFGYTLDGLIGLQVLDLVAPQDRDLVAENLRRRMSGEASSLEYEFRGLRRDGRIIEVGVHGNVARLRGRRVVVGVLQDITERKHAQQLAEQHLARMQVAMSGAVGALSRMVDLRDPYTAGHERRVACLATEIARDLGVSAEEVRGLEVAAQVHDIGKISVPSEILSKPMRLSAIEFDLVKLHAANGRDILEAVEFPWPVAAIVAQHHERLDGSGYPEGLRNGAIVPLARILCVADVVEAMSSHRPYRASLGIAPALAEIEAGAGARYDADVCASALRLFRDKGYTIPA